MFVLYMPVSIVGFQVFGYKVKDNIIENLDENWLRTVSLVLITGHVLTAFNIILNPVFQGFEEIFKAPKSQFFSLSV
jgi:vesicular inhibitory amino acid transporter